MAYQALYRKYRPQVFADVIGQEHIVTTLLHQVETGRIAHAYVFSGTRGTGKTTTAKIFAKAINCTDPQNGEPCGACQACLHNAGTSSDIIEIDAASNNGVDEIRDLRDKVRFAPLECKYKVYIIDEVHMLSPGAFNALLKTLEEPPAHAVFILATTEPQKLPATILSRCQRYEFHRISVNDIISRLKTVLNDTGAVIDDEGLRAIASAAEGGMRDALSIADQCISFCGDNVSAAQVQNVLGSMDFSFMFDTAQALISGDIPAAMTQLQTVLDLGRDLLVFTRELEAHFRNLMLISACGGARQLIDCTEDSYKRYAEQAKSCPVERALRTITLLNQAQADIKLLTFPRVVLECALMRICRPEDEASVEALIDRISTLENKLASGAFVAAAEKPALPVEKAAAPKPEKAPSEPAQAAENARTLSSVEQKLFDKLKSEGNKAVTTAFRNGSCQCRLKNDVFEIVTSREALANYKRYEEALSMLASEIRSGTTVRFTAAASPEKQPSPGSELSKAAGVMFGEENIHVK